MKSTTETVYNIVDGQKGGVYSKNITIYNAGGNRLEKVRYGSDGSLKVSILTDTMISAIRLKSFILWQMENKAARSTILLMIKVR